MKKTVTMVLLTLSVCAMAQKSEMQKYYFENRMKEVKSIISLNKNKEHELTATYDELCKTQPDEETHWLFKIAMRRVVNDSAKIIAVSEKEIVKAATAKVPFNLVSIKIDMQLSADQVKALESIVFERWLEYHKLDYLYPNNVEGWVKAEKRLVETYGKKLNLEYARLGLKTYLSYGATALMYVRELSLSDKQIDVLVDLSLTLKKILPSNPDYKTKQFTEFSKTKEILSKPQYDKFLECKVKSNVQAEVQKSWNEMEKYNMSAEIDSATVSKILLPFYTKLEVVKLRYNNIANGEEQKQIQLENLNAMRPAILKKLNAVKNREKKKTALQPNALSW